MKVLIVQMIFLIGVANCVAQSNNNLSTPQQPTVGNPIPPFLLDNVKYYKTSKVSNADFKGKWLFLDFWFMGCASCIKSFAKMDSLQRQFENEAVFLLVGRNDIEAGGPGIERLYDKIRVKRNLGLASAYDSVLGRKWNINAMPHIIIVDPDGVVRVLTDGRDMTIEKVQMLIDNQKVSFWSIDERPLFKQRDAFSLSDSTVLFYSSLTKWSGESQMVRNGIKDEMKYLKNGTGMVMSMVPLEWLYNLAYLGSTTWEFPSDSLFDQVYPKPKLELDDPGLFYYDFKTEVGKGLYNYALKIPSRKASVSYVMNIMQQDLKNVFGYTAVLETRRMPVWKLVLSGNSSKHLKTKGGKPAFENDNSNSSMGFTMRNGKLQTLLNVISTYAKLDGAPYFDETGITGNVDITIEADMTNYVDINKALHKIGLRLIKGEKEMKVLVIRD